VRTQDKREWLGRSNKENQGNIGGARGVPMCRISGKKKETRES
jgi:hypothetical protein